MIWGLGSSNYFDKHTSKGSLNANFIPAALG